METQIENKMGVMPVNSLLLKTGAPLIFSMLIGALYNVVDSMFVARLGENALTSVSLAFPIQSIVIACGSGIGVGISSNLSRFLGQGEKQKANAAARNGLLVGGAIYIFFLLFGIWGINWFFKIQTDIAEIIEMGSNYLRIISLLSFFQIFQIILERLLQSTGKSIYSMYTQVLGCIVNLILDPIMIFGLFGFPAMGVTGAALATMIGIFCGMVFALILNITKNKEIAFLTKEKLLSLERTKEICTVGIPTVLMQSMSAILSFGVNKILLSYSVTAAATFAIFFKLQTFVCMAIFGLDAALIPIVAYNYGAKNLERIKKAIFLSGIYSTLIGMIGTILLFTLPETFLKMFDATEKMLAIGIPAIKIMSISFLFAGLGIMVSYAFQGFGKGIASLIISALRQCIILLPLAWLLSKFWGVYGVWWSFLIAEAITAVIAFIWLRIEERKLEEKLYHPVGNDV
ncbi:MATE efflux family protein [Marvinbryantia formatexigens DSM 14469]|uniref:Probable multidrug resistance protein NorM n=1 Tax=Marvinbryantia formatexigens DSM 14469 TaxID=478749 RepID=C6LJ08_9FIRM|nr:MATE family efflux transporter [Marvinbryantia formatexigens]EET59328.1 MATE efflux family protein [Marvinbryantia formatexigens DSM 14469]UWO24400.1 MATE family efflux transporter [Marvinbryantia formatexigens DSM 14469]SDF50245.1 putative efflux protein, MATE family [Marvinbryantia formatexigens]